MNQPALPFDDGYPEGFWIWLPKNSHVWRAFEQKALRMARTGRKHYSARTIIENIRWTTDLADTDTTFRINDHYTPGLARLWMGTHGDRFPGFFELRT